MGNERSFKKFSTGAAKQERDISFEIEYTDQRGRPVTDTFHCIPVLAANAIEEFSRLSASEQWVSAVTQFIESLLVEDDVTRWQRLMKNRRAAITVEELGEIFDWLQEQYTDRPTQPSNGSPVGRTTTSTG